MSHAERQLEEQFIENLRGLKYEYRQDIRDRAALEQNFRHSGLDGQPLHGAGGL